MNTTDRLLVLLNCFFNTSDIERTLISLINTEFPCDIIFLENPSKYSDSIRILAKKYNIYKHFMCSDNIEGNIFHIFCNTHKHIIDQYRYIAMSEADVVLDKNALHECIGLLDNSTDRVDLASIDLHLNTEKYHNLPISQWVPTSSIVDNYLVGHTGFQFIVFKKNTLNEFITSLNNKKISAHVALGVHNYYGLSDTNLFWFVHERNKLWIRTLDSKLDHIGWEHYIQNDDEYVQEKNKNITSGKLRTNLTLANYSLIEL
uniref:Glycosyltransferase 2-like domain-containing protein n=1 Tax=viral metagenome TaxID=1070528 RepID=A0A6C0JNA3_9ZZZZ